MTAVNQAQGSVLDQIAQRARSRADLRRKRGQAGVDMGRPPRYSSDTEGLRVVTE